jgi:hypothetical protein
MTFYKLYVRAMGTNALAATVDFTALQDDAAITRSVQLAGGFAYDLFEGSRLVQRR